MKVSHLLSYASALIPSSQGLKLILLAPSGLTDQARVTGKKTSEGQIVEMTRATDDPDSGALCPASVFSQETDCTPEEPYFGFAKIEFSQPTDAPRPINVTLPDYELQCNVTVKTTDASVNAYWYVGWGLDELAGNEDYMKFRCYNITNVIDIIFDRSHVDVVGGWSIKWKCDFGRGMLGGLQIESSASDKPCRKLHFALVVYPQFEVLDAFGPTEVLHCLGSPSVYPKSQDIRLSVIGPELSPVSTGPVEGDPSPVKSLVSQTIVPTHTFDNPPEVIDVLIVPGGFGAGPKALFGGDWEPPCAERVVRFLKDQYPELKHLLTICNGAGLAARAGILDGHKATTNKQLWSAIVSTGPKTHWIAQARWVVADEGKLWTSSGVSAGTDAMLALVDHIYGKNSQGQWYGDVIKEGMEWNRVDDSTADSFATSNEVSDVPPLQ